VNQPEPSHSPETRDGSVGPPEQPAVPLSPVPGRRLMHPFLRVFLYVVGYFVVALLLSSVGAVVVGILAAIGVFETPAIDPNMSAFDVEAILEFVTPYLFQIAILTGLYTILYTWAYMRIVDRRPLVSLGLHLRRRWLPDALKGAGLAALILGVIFAFSLAVGQIRVEGFARPAPDGTHVVLYLIGALVAFAIVGLYEEIMFRGYVLQTLHERTGKITAILISSLIFAVLHGANPGADLFGIFNTTIIGAILSVLYFRTRSLWMPVGFHFAWNFFLGYVYSLPVSGIPVHGILDVVEIEPASRLTGGSYGPEAGLVCTIALAVWGGWLIWKRSGVDSDSAEPDR
jgi:membrane protease YdiL (CAAX protease family)